MALVSPACTQQIAPESARAETYGGEGKRVDFDTEGCNVLLLELSSQVTLDEGGLVKTWYSQ